MKKILPLVIVAAFIGQHAFSQNIELSPTVIASAGNYSEAGGIGLSWTLGEVAVTTLQQGDIVLAQGFQQSFLKQVGFATDPIKWQIAAYPNPVQDKLWIQFDLPEAKDFNIEISDVNGRLVSQKEYTQLTPGEVIPVDVSALGHGMYFFRVTTTDRRQTRVINITKL
jgi:hypothetical protein